MKQPKSAKKRVQRGEASVGGFLLDARQWQLQLVRPFQQIDEAATKLSTFLCWRSPSSVVAIREKRTISEREREREAQRARAPFVAARQKSRKKSSTKYGWLLPCIYKLMMQLLLLQLLFRNSLNCVFK